MWKSWVLASSAFVICASGASAQTWFSDVTATNLPPRESTTHASMDIGAVDLDGDGDLDLIVPQEWQRNKVLINDGRGRFTLANDTLPAPPAEELIKPEGVQAPLAGKDSEDVSMADFNGDGRLDVIIAVEDDIKLGRANVHQYYRGLGGGRFERIYGQLPDTVANAVAHADINGDDAPDVYLAGDAQDRLLINDRGNFRDETEARLPRESAVAQDIEFFDADGDNDLDIVLGLEGGHALWINNGQGVFADESRARLPVPGNVEARKVTPADVDGDGDLDLYFAHVSWQGREPQDRLYINDGRGHFSDGTAGHIPADDRLTLDAKFADLDGDGDIDLVQANNNSVRIYDNDGQGRFTDVTMQALGVEELPGNNLSVELADLNGDRRPDLYVGQLGNANGPGAHDRLFLNVTRGRRR